MPSSLRDRPLAILWVGRRTTDAWQDLISDYLGRIGRFATITEIRLRPAGGRDGDPRRALAEEAAAITSHLGDGDFVVALDERGRERTTVELARLLSEKMPVRRVVFILGSDIGLDPEVRERADEVLALSRMTLPHHLARLLLCEQVYRALDLTAGGPYHRGCSQ